MTPAMRFIRSDADLDWHIVNLVAGNPAFAPLRAHATDIPLRWLDPGFKGLAWVITGQQISVAAGRAIFGRLEAALGTIAADALAAAPDETLRAAGLSAPKIRTFRALERAVAGGGLDFEALHNANAGDAIATLCGIKGIGPWTAEVYLLFAAGHPDIFPAGDVALQEAARLAFGLDARPDAKAFRTMSQDWAPWRSAAARLLWAYYRAVKGGGAGMPI